jgi:preprotein translocase subunit SecB
MQRSPLELQHYHFSRLELVAQTGTDGSPSSVHTGQYPSFEGVDSSADVQVAAPNDQTSPFQFALKLKLAGGSKTEQSQFPYAFVVEVEGFFQVEAPDEEAGRNLLVGNGAAILYGAVREQLLTLSARFSQGPMLLPTVSFLNMLKKETSKDARQQPPSRAKGARSKKLKAE